MTNSIKNKKTKVLGTVTEVDTKQVTEVFGKKIGKLLENCEGKTFLDILINSGWFTEVEQSNNDTSSLRA